jgi:hypothetical protein
MFVYYFSSEVYSASYTDSNGTLVIVNDLCFVYSENLFFSFCNLFASDCCMTGLILCV